MNTTARREQWSSRLGFILVAAGAAAGLGNIWKFPYVVGENGGGAFIAVYVLALAAVGLPILAAELMLGRMGNSNIVDGFRSIAIRLGRSPKWSAVGWIGLATLFVVLSFYSVVGAWILAYLASAVTHLLESGSSQPVEGVAATFGRVTSDVATVIAWHTIFMAITTWIVGSGVRNGIERLCRWLMPLLLVLLVVLVGYFAVTTQHFGTAFRYLFAPSYSSLDANAVLIAVGHAFFTLGIGVGAMMTFGSYLPSQVSIGRASLAVATLDTIVALTACLAIYPIVFAHNLDASAGPGLVFVTLPIAFAEMQYGSVVSVLFFALLAVAALTSSPSMLEPLVARVRERAGVVRRVAVLRIAVPVWLIGIAQALSFSDEFNLGVLNLTLFEVSEFLVSNLMLPICGLLIAVFAGWILPAPRSLRTPIARIWHWTLRYVTPISIAILVVNGVFA